MAIEVYTGMDERYGLAEQSAWGTEITDGAAFIQVRVEHADITPGVNLRRPSRATGQRAPLLSDFVADAKGQEHMFPYRGPMHKEIAALLEYGIMQNVTESTTSDDGWKKTYVPPATQPDFSANAGKFFTAIKRMPVASTSKKIYDAVFRTLEVECRPGEGEDADLTATGDLVGRQYSATSNPSGTWTAPTLTTFNFYDLTTKTIGGTDVVIGDGGFRISRNSNLKRIGGGSSLFETFGFNLPNVVEVEIDVLWDTTTRAAMAAHLAGTEATLILAWGTVDTDGYLNYTLRVNWDAAPVNSAEEGTFVTLTGTAGEDSSANPPISTVLCDGVDRGF
jgi:hypothetical protein